MRPVPYSGDAQIQQYLRETFAEIVQRIDALEKSPLLNLVEVYQAPGKVRGGDIIFADGTTWDPGSGRGLYVYNINTAAWVQLLSLP